MKNSLVCLILLSLLPLHLLAADDSNRNIVIESDETVFRFIPDKQGSSIVKIEESNECRLRANNSAEDARLLFGYNDYLKLDKVSGGRQTYGSAFGNNVFYSDSKGCLVEVPLKKAGDNAQVKYRRTWLKPEFLSPVLLYARYPMEKATVSFEIPMPMASRYTFDIGNYPSGKAVMTDTIIKDVRYVSFTFSDIPAYEELDDAPPAGLTVPKITIRGHFRDVNSLYRYLYGYIPKDDPGASAVRAKAAELTSGLTTDMEKASAIYDYVHSAIRYIAVENGELGHRPDLASEVLKKLYGDCKGSAILLRDMLHAVGIDSRLAWIGVHSITDNWSDNPNISSGNHMIAAAFIGDSIIYLDGTAKYNSINVPPLAICGREAMIENGPDECLLPTVPPAVPEANSRKQSLVFTLDGKNLKATGRQVLTGIYNTSFHYADQNKSVAQKPGFYQKLFGSCMANTRDDKAECILTADSAVITGSATAVGCVSPIGDKTYVDLNDAYVVRDMRFATKGRNVGGELQAPVKHVYHSEFALPEGYSPAVLPADFSISNPWIDASMKYQLSADGLTVSRDVVFTVKEKYVGIDDMESFNNDIINFHRACSSKIVLNNP